MTKNNKTSVFSAGTKLFLGCFFLIAVIIPLIKMLLNLANANFIEIFSNSQVLTASKHSVTVSLTATIFSIILAFFAAYAIERTQAKLKSIFHILILLPMLIPSISHGWGLVILWGSNGTLTRFLGLSEGIYGFWGIVLGSVMYSFPVAYLMISDILKYEDSTPYEAARVMGIPPHRRLTAITLPYLKKPMISVVFATFTLIVTDYGVPMMIGGMYKTLPVLMYEEVINRLDFSKGSVFGMILLIPAVLAFLADFFCKNEKQNNTISRPFQIDPKPLRDTLSQIGLIMIALFTLFPILSFVRLTFTKRYPTDMSFTADNILSTFRKGADIYLTNSLIIGLFVALIGTSFAFVCAYYTARRPGKGTKILHLLSILSLAIPGIVLGLSYVLFFNNSFLYGTLAILIMANTIHFFSSPYLMIYNSMGKLNPNLEAVGLTLGIRNFHLVKDVILPQTATTLAEMFSYFFVNSMMTISAVSFLANRDTTPISLMLPQFEAQMLLEASAFVSLMILGVNLLMKAAIWLIKRIISTRKAVSYAD